MTIFDRILDRYYPFARCEGGYMGHQPVFLEIDRTKDLTAEDVSRSHPSLPKKLRLIRCVTTMTSRHQRRWGIMRGLTAEASVMLSCLGKFEELVSIHETTLTLKSRRHWMTLTHDTVARSYPGTMASLVRSRSPGGGGIQSEGTTTLRASVMGLSPAGLLANEMFKGS